MFKINYNFISRSWIKTDDDQKVLKIRDGLYLVAQIRCWFDDYCVSISVIDFDTYDDEDIKDIARYFGYSNSIESLDEQVVAEMLAEEIYDFEATYKGTYEECELWIDDGGLSEYSKEVYKY